MSDAVYTLHRGTAPLLVSVPHVGTEIPADIAAQLVPRALQTEDADWHLDRLYAFARDLGASVLVPRFARYVVDLNRPPENTPMYPGRNNTELCPTRFFSGEPLYRDGRTPDDAEVARRVAVYWRPYHDALAAELERLRAAHGRAMLLDGHSIQAELPWLFEGRLPDLNLGTAGGASCAPALRERLAACWPPTRASTPRRRRPLQGRLHHATLRPPGRRRPRGADGDVLGLLHDAATRLRRDPRRRRAAGAARAGRDADRMEP